jgi:hypothetical protein
MRTYMGVSCLLTHMGVSKHDMESKHVRARYTSPMQALAVL